MPAFPIYLNNYIGMGVAAQMENGLRLRIVLRKGVAFGPGKADLLQAIHATGSIAAAGRELGMSYSRAWLLVHAMNREFRAPLVTPAKGGAARGGASLTALGIEVLARYRALEEAAERSKEVAALRRSVGR
jgi:molybdate transport system regulatory protein